MTCEAHQQLSIWPQQFDWIRQMSTRIHKAVRCICSGAVAYLCKTAPMAKFNCAPF